MVDELEALARRLETAENATRMRMSQLVISSAGILLDINRAYIEQEGQRTDGQEIQSGGYSPAYAKFKQKYGKFKNTSFVDLKLTGAFLASLELVATGELQYLVVATDAKASFLSKYGPLLGIREADLDDFVVSILTPELQTFLLSHLQA